MGNTGSSFGAHLDFSVIKLKTGYSMEHVDILKDIDVKFNYYDPELYLDSDLPGAEEKIIERVQVGSFEHPEYAVRRYDLLKSEGYDTTEFRLVHLRSMHTHSTCIISLPKSMTATLQQKPAKKSESIRLENLQAKLYRCNK